MADTYSVERSTSVDAPPERVYEHVADFHRWTAWSPWEDVDPDLTRSYSGPDAGVGATYRWSGNRKAGQGRMEIVEADPPARVVIDLVFEKPWKAHNETLFTIVPSADPQGPTEVTWTMTGPTTLATRVMGLFSGMDKMVGKDFEKGLARLKAVAEQAPGGPSAAP
jgi:uncharacterized protein YndB with AHSA1/START domain